jgi:hypothetical protein
MTHAAPATTAPRAIDIARAVKESLTHSQIVKARFQFRRTGILGNRDRLDAVAHGASHIAGNASLREKQNVDRADR